MATVEKINGKNGVTYRITVSNGFDSSGKRIRHRKTWKPKSGMTPRQIDKALCRVVSDFEQSIAQGYVIDNRQTFAEYASYVLQIKERAGKKHRTIEGYRQLLKRTNQAIGHMALQDIRAYHLNRFYSNLAERGVRDKPDVARGKSEFRKLLKTQNMSLAKTAELARLSIGTIKKAGNGGTILLSNAETIAQVVDLDLHTLFEVEVQDKPLSNTTILSYHRFIHAVLAQAEKEMLVPYNAADKATPPTKNRSHVGTFQIAELILIRDAIEKEPIKWQMLIHLLMITGCRRGEVVGLKWDKVNWNDSSIRIDTTLVYTSDRGLYESSTKTDADRIIKLPKVTMDLLREYQLWQLETSISYGDRWQRSSYVFTNEYGGPLAPYAIGSYLRRFEKKYCLPHVHAHKFRHSMASVLYFSGADPVSISKRLGHSQVSTTQNIYSHLIDQADVQSAERIADVIFNRNSK